MDCEQLPVEWSYLSGHIIRSSPAQTYHRYTHCMNRTGPSAVPCGTPETIGIHSLHGSTINHDALPVIGEELSIQLDGMYTATYANRFQFEQETKIKKIISGAYL